ncbi:MAG TPA: hemolysin III family protein [Gemmatimonas sp.]|nr:hemolysin III family protein [Gemmatimonas sp.]
MTAKVDRIASRREEIANAVTHGIGLLLALIGTPVLVVAAHARGETLAVVGAGIFGGALIALYTASTLYHAVSHHVTKTRLRLMDHVAIYLLIAGTYTPFTFGVLRGRWGWTMFAIVWSLAAIGVFGKLRYRFRHEKVSTMLYVAMGWVALIAARPMITTMETTGLILLLGGGLLYTGGVIFYRQNHSWSHPVWHLFVMSGSACHYFAVLWYAHPPLAVPAA